MEKIEVVLAVLNKDALENTLKQLELDNVNLNIIFVDGFANSFQVDGKQIPCVPFLQIQRYIRKYKNFVWLIGGYINDVGDVRKLKKFLMSFDIPEDNIVNLEIFTKLSPTWFANLRYVEKNDVSFFATGNEYMRDGLNLKFIPSVKCTDKNFEEMNTSDSQDSWRNYLSNKYDVSFDRTSSEVKEKTSEGVNLAQACQDLWQSYLTAKYIFERVGSEKFKFVLIGLTPDCFCCDRTEDFFGFQKILSLAKTKPEQEDLNFDNIKDSLNRNFSAQAIVDWNDDIKLSSSDVYEKNVQILKDYIELCLANGAKPVGVVFPVAQAIWKTYNADLLKNFRETIRQLEENYDFRCVDMFDSKRKYISFCDMTHLNLRGSEFANSCLSFELYKKNLIPIESFCDVTYEYLDKLSYMIPKDDYNDFLNRIFEVSAQRIRRKDKVKLAFVLYNASMWMGDDLYNFFANDSRFEVTVFLYRIAKVSAHEFIKDDFSKGLEQLKSHGLNVIPLNGPNASVPEQDVILFLTSYPEDVPNAFKFDNLTVKSLAAYVSYSFSVASRGAGFYNRRIFHASWKLFFSSKIALDTYEKKSLTGMPRGLFSGYPRTDIFFDKNTKFQFKWKMARPNAKKIIWAPHHSMGIGVNYGTFHLNYEFMYEFAKSHPETSWVLKPHPALAYRAVDIKLFPSDKAFKEYMQKWDDLPNAQVYTGGYYQDIFATSDGMIHDSGSFIAEYQFVHKPMIYLTREGEKFNALGDKILKVSYLVDGKDLDDIATLMQRVFIDGDDYKATKREQLFNSYLNYPKFNGMSASEFIYKSIADELKEVSL